MSLRWVAYRLEVQQTPKKTHNLYNYIFLKGAIEWFITGFAKVISRDSRTNMLPLFSYYWHHTKRTFGRLWETEKSDYLATNTAREDKKQKLLIFVKCQRKEPFLSGITPFRCLIPPPMRHLNDRNATPRQGNATPFFNYFLYICCIIARLESCRIAIRHTCSSCRQASYSSRSNLRSDEPMGLMMQPIPS